MSLTGRVLLTLVGLVTSTGCYIADWNETHIYNPLWPPHAKFHNGQTMSMGLGLGLCTLYYVYRTPPTSPLQAARKKSDSNTTSVQYKEARKSDVNTAALFASLYWLTQLSAFLYPDSLALDPPGSPDFFKAPQVYISGVLLGMTGIGWALEMGGTK